MEENDEIRVRPGDPMDEAAVVLLADRMASFPMPNARSRGEIAAALRPRMRASVHDHGPDATLLIAEHGRQGTLGCVRVMIVDDPWSGQPCARVDVLAVRDGAEGLGIASMLLEAACDWARGQGVRRMFCDVFDSNSRGREFCEKRGFQRDTLTYLKEL